jgi:hypothetical protein
LRSWYYLSLVFVGWCGDDKKIAEWQENVNEICAIAQHLFRGFLREAFVLRILYNK